MSFSSFGLHADLLRGITELGFTQPTDIQRDSIPAAILGRDVMACSMTGSGKTAAFGLPILQRLIGKNRRVTRALILTPTRELAAQIDDHLASLASGTSIKSAAVYGGVSMGPQKRAFHDGVDIIVGTPGRLLDHFQSSYARLDGLEILVLDEADRMLDMGFLPDIRRILKQLPAKRQTLFFSATMPREIVSLAKEMLKDPLKVNLERTSLPATGVTQTVYPVPHHLKSDLLLKLTQSPDVKSVLVFTRTKHRADRLAQFLTKQGVPCGIIHGNRSQSQRSHALQAFKHGRYRLLVATDVAARGIDVEALSHVVNFDMPNQPEDYIHRVGRTARAELTGDAFTFVASDEEGGLRAIERAIGKKLPRVIVPDFDYKQEPKKSLSSFSDSGRSSWGDRGDRGGRPSFRREGGYHKDNNGNRRDGPRGGPRGGYDRQSGYGQRSDRPATSQYSERPASSQYSERPASSQSSDRPAPSYSDRPAPSPRSDRPSNSGRPARPWERERSSSGPKQGESRGGAYAKPWKNKRSVQGQAKW